MRVAVNAAFFRPADIGGSGVYLQNLIPRLLKLDSELDLILFAPPDALSMFEDNPRLKKRALPGADRFQRRIYYEQVLIPKAARATGAHLIFSAGTSGPLMSPVPHISALMDLQHRHYPEYFSLRTRAFRWVFWEGAIKRADAVVAISEFTKNDLIAQLGIDAEKIEVIHLGAETREPPADVVEAVSKRVPQPFIFLPGRTYPHKGHLTLIRAFDAIASRIPHHLVFCGAPDRAHDEVMQAIAGSPHGARIHHLGRISSGEVAALFRLADILAFPSEFEGFGLPLIEAMTVGCPVVATSAASIPEVVGDAALLVPPGDHEALAEAILKVLSDSGLRGKLVERGRTRARGFSWDRCAERTLDLFKRIAGA